MKARGDREEKHGRDDEDEHEHRHNGEGADDSKAQSGEEKDNDVDDVGGAGSAGSVRKMVNLPGMNLDRVLVDKRKMTRLRRRLDSVGPRETKEDTKKRLLSELETYCEVVLYDKGVDLDALRRKHFVALGFAGQTISDYLKQKSLRDADEA